MFRSRRLSYLLVIPLAFLLMGARAVPLVDPAPIAIPDKLTSKDVSKAIRSALTQRGWVVSKDDPGKIDATLHLRAHTANISITYNKEAVKIAYVGSENLLYEEKNGERYIHRNYLKWINNTVQDISNALQVASIQAES